jgi:hypothetical protein
VSCPADLRRAFLLEETDLGINADAAEFGRMEAGR